MYCEKCGGKIKEGNGFCTSCGNAISTSVKSQNNSTSNKKIVFIIIAVLVVVSLIILGFNYWERKNKGKELSIKQVFSSEEISSQEIENISKSVVFLHCFDENESKTEILGSGTMISKAVLTGEKTDLSDYFILTNGHVIKDDGGTYNEKLRNNNYCVASLGSFDNKFGYFSYNSDFQSDNNYFFKEPFDIALLKYNEIMSARNKIITSIDKKELESRILKDYSSCPRENVIGKKVYIIGYPASTYRTILDEEITSQLITTSGLVSGIDENGDFYTDAKIDAGNSGGLAVSKVNGEVCLLGIPTWVSQGDYENLGLIQSFEDTKKLIEVGSDDIPKKGLWAKDKIDSLDVEVNAKDDSIDVIETYNFNQTQNNFEKRISKRMLMPYREVSVSKIELFDKDSSKNDFKLTEENDEILIQSEKLKSNKIILKYTIGNTKNFSIYLGNYLKLNIPINLVNVKVLFNDNLSEKWMYPSCDVFTEISERKSWSEECETKMITPKTYQIYCPKGAEKDESVVLRLRLPN